MNAAAAVDFEEGNSDEFSAKSLTDVLEDIRKYIDVEDAQQREIDHFQADEDIVTIGDRVSSV